MTRLTIWPDSDPAHEDLSTSERDIIARELDAIGVAYSHVEPSSLGDGATSDDVMAAHQVLIDRLCAEHGYTLVDVAQLHLSASSPDDAKETAAAARLKFLNEHTHDEEEIRYFTQGAGIFYLHVGDRVLAVHCTAGDLLSVPALTTHWFDMGSLPDFTAIRFFRSDDGWVGTFTGNDIAASFPTFDELAAEANHG